MPDMVLPERPRPRYQKFFEKPSRTRASEAHGTDLKALVERFRISGASPPPMQYGDASGLPQSRLEAMQLMSDAAEAFQSLPLKVRQAISHDPRRLEEWIFNNPDLAREHGLLAELSPQSSPESPPSSGTEEGPSGTDGG